MTKKNTAMDLNAPIESLIKCADNHADDTGDPDHAAGDLQDLLRAAWGIMNVEQKRSLLSSAAVESVVETGARDEFDVETLQDNLNSKIAAMEGEIINAKFAIQRGEARGTCYWEYEGHASPDRSRADTVVDAYDHLQTIRASAKKTS